MERVVVVVQKTINGPSQVFLQEPADRDDADTPIVLDTPQALALLEEIKTAVERINAAAAADHAPQAPTAGDDDDVNGPPELVKDVGAKLLDLLSLHPAIKQQVVPLLDQAKQQRQPIYLLLKDPNLEKLPWEALYADNAGFVSCDPRWAVARAQKVVEKKPEAVFVPPLKIMAILGASGSDALTHISAREEWLALYSALRQSKLNIRLRVLVCEEDLKADIDAEQQPWIETGLLFERDEENLDVFQQIRAFSPQILHLFCHGLADPTPLLQVASAQDWELQRPGSIFIEGPQLRQQADPSGNIWLVTLNCCESGRQGDGGGSRSLPMASTLVSAGFPAVVGMRERVESRLANVFSGLFYDGFLTDFVRSIEEAGGDQVKNIHWACGLYAARRSICKEIVKDAPYSVSAARLKEWTIPVLFTRLQMFRLKVVNDASAAEPLFRSELKPQAAAAGPAVPPPPKKTLTQKEIRDLADELEQLQKDRESFKHLAPVVRKIDARIKDIEAELNA